MYGPYRIVQNIRCLRVSSKSESFHQTDQAFNAALQHACRCMPRERRDSSIIQFILTYLSNRQIESGK